MLRAVFNRIKGCVDAVNKLQDTSGGVVKNASNARQYLEDIKLNLLEMLSLDEGVRKENIYLLIDDIDNWIAQGLASAPDFSKTSKDLFAFASSGGYVVFVGPYKLANGGRRRGRFLECFLGKTDVPKVLLAVKAKYKHPKDKTISLKYIDGSDGLVNSNNVVFFPENISSSGRIEEQPYAVFTFEKFERIYKGTTYPLIQEYFGSEASLFGGGSWPSADLSSCQIYEARCIWGYLHDMYHFLGPRPFDENIRLKMLKPLGLLEEIKVDCQCVLLLWGNQEIPYSNAIVEYILFERLLRYPLESDYATNFDSGTGFFLSSILFSMGGLSRNENKISIDKNNLLDAVRYVVEQISHIEALSDDEYKQSGISLIRRHVLMNDIGEFDKQRYSADMAIG